ncbi:MAG: hypothetical protein ABI310_09175, partial [Microbacteriaceae bacterium]
MKIKTLWGASAITATLAVFGALAVPVTAQAAADDSGSSTTQQASTSQSMQTPAPTPTPTQAPTPGPTDTATAAPTSTPTSSPTLTSSPTPTSSPTLRSQAVPGLLLAAPQLGEVASDPLTVEGSFKASKLSLVNGVYGGGAAAPTVSVDGTQGYTFTSKSVAGQPATTPSMNVSYRIALLNGALSEYWMTAYAGVQVTGAPGASAPSSNTGCQIRRGGPTGSVVTDASPYICETTAQKWFAQPGDRYMTINVRFLVRNNVAAEVQSVVKTAGDVSLDSGYWEMNAGNWVAGSATLAPDSTTRADAILRDGDTPVNASLARSIFVYRMAIGGSTTSFWVMGTAGNYRGSTRFSHTSTCDIYDQNPLKGIGTVDAPKPVSVSLFSCNMTSQIIDGYRGNWEVTFTIAAIPMRTITGVVEQSELIARFCTTDRDNCGVSLASATKFMGPGERASDIIANDTDITNSHSETATRTVTITNTLGVKITESGQIPGLFKLSVEESYSWAIATTTTYSKTDVLNILP